jgi:hypothetical protein
MSELVGACRSLSVSVGVCRDLSESVGICRSTSVGACRSLSLSENVEDCRRLSDNFVDFGELRLNPRLDVVILGVPDARSPWHRCSTLLTIGAHFKHL